MTSMDNKRTCSATTKRGDPCRARAVTLDGRCAMHGGLTDPRELGRLGGRGRARSVLGISEAVADESLRAQAKQALEQALGSENEQVRLRAAQSLYSYRAAPPPSESGAVASQGLALQDGRKVVGLADLLELCLEKDGIRGVFDGARMQDVILRAAERVRELQAAGVRVETPNR